MTTQVDKDINKMNIYKIRVIKGQEFKVRCEVVDEKEFFFKVVYEKAYDCIRDITAAATKSRKNNVRNNDCNNNIIAFCGERGEGKTSAMLSFSHTLMIENNKSESVFGKKSHGIFHVIDPIDPAQFENKDNMLNIVLSRIFKEFKDYFKSGQESKDQKNIDIERKNSILTIFQKCYQYIKIIKSGSALKPDESYDDMLIELATLGDSANLKNELQNLIEKFLEAVHPNSEHNYLVLQIDDMDLNTSRAHEIIEDIRKYLMIPQVIILMATKIEQLSKAVEQSFRNHYDIMIRQGRMTESEPQQMAIKYISKLISDRHRIFLPKIKAIPDNAEGKIIIDYTAEDKMTHNSTEAKNSLFPNDEEDFQSNILKFIYNKTSIKFLKPEQGAHYIIPQTMRELSNFLSILSELKDFSNSPEETEGNPADAAPGITPEEKFRNIQVFEEYIVKTWIHNNLDDGYIDYINDFVNTPNNRKHEKIITKLYDILTEHKIVSLKSIYDNNRKEREIYNEYIKSMKSTLFRNKFYSIGNVIDTLVKIENYFPVESIRLFTFAIKTLYTITLYKIYFASIVSGKDESYFKSVYIFMGGDLFGADNINNFFPSIFSGQSRFNFKLENKYSKGTIPASLSKYTYLGYKFKADPLCLYSNTELNNTPINFELCVRFFKYMKDLATKKDETILDFFNMELIYDIILKQNQQYNDNEHEYIKSEDNSLELLKYFYDVISANTNLGAISVFASEVLSEFSVSMRPSSALRSLFRDNEGIPQTFDYAYYYIDDDDYISNAYDITVFVASVEDFIKDFKNYTTNKDMKYNLKKMGILQKLGERLSITKKNQETPNKEVVLNNIIKANTLMKEIVESAKSTAGDIDEDFLRTLRTTL